MWGSMRPEPGPQRGESLLREDGPQRPSRRLHGIKPDSLIIAPGDGVSGTSHHEPAEGRGGSKHRISECSSRLHWRQHDTTSEGSSKDSSMAAISSSEATVGDKQLGHVDPPFWPRSGHADMVSKREPREECLTPGTACNVAGNEGTKPDLRSRTSPKVKKSFPSHSKSSPTHARTHLSRRDHHHQALRIDRHDLWARLASP